MNNTALAIIQPDELDVIQRTGRMLAASGYFDAKGESAQAIAMMATKILAGREMGIGPFAAVNGIHIISGKPSVGANLQASAVKSSGRYDYRVRELTDKVCRIEFFERVDGKWESVGVSEFTAEDARKAGTKNMDKYPKNMLFARAMSNGVRFHAPNIFGGNAVYVPEELGADVDDEGNVIEVSGRRIDTATGEIVESDVNFYNASQTAQDAQDNPFDDSTAYYVHAWHTLTGNAYDFVNWIQALHRKDEPCSDKQYQFLTGIVDDLTNEYHGYALSILCQAEISGANKPSRMAAKALLRHLQTEINAVDENNKEIKDDKGKTVKVANPDYRADFADIVTALCQEKAAQEAQSSNGKSKVAA